MDKVLVELNERKSFLDSNTETVNGLIEAWHKKYGTSYGTGLNELEAFVGVAKRETDKIAGDIEDRIIETKDADDFSDEALIRRTERQIRKRRIQTPTNFRDGDKRSVGVLERAVCSSMWLVHYKWRTKSSWNNPARDAHASFLCGRSDNQDWAVRVPGTLTSISSALDWLIPGAVRNAQRKGQKIYRQGDM